MEKSQIYTSNDKTHLSSFVQYIQSYNSLVVISKMILSNPHSKYSAHIFPSLLLIRVPNRKWSRAISILMAQTSRVHIQDILAMSPVSGKNSRRVLVQASRLNTAWNHQRISNKSSCGALAWNPHQYPTYAGGQVLRGNSQLNIVSSFLGAQGAVSCVDIRFSASLCTPSPLLPSCFWHSSDPGPSAVCCGSHLHTCHEKTAVVRHNIISAAEREGKACVAVPLSVYSAEEFNSRASVQWTNIFTIKTCKSCPPPWALTARTCNTITTKPVGEQGCWKKILYLKINMSFWGVHSPQLYSGWL